MIRRLARERRLKCKKIPLAGLDCYIIDVVYEAYLITPKLLFCRWLATSNVGVTIDLVQSFISVLSVVTFILGTYDNFSLENAPWYAVLHADAHQNINVINDLNFLVAGSGMWK